MARRKPKPNNSEKNNFQDKAMDREKLKGERDAENSEESSRGKQESSSSDKGGDGNSDNDKRKGKPAVAIYTGAANPIDMHSFNDAYLEPLGKITTNLRNGYPETLSFANNFTPSWQGQRPLSNQQLIGGVMAIPFIPTIGETADVNDGINLANVTLFNHVRAATGGTSYYEAPDLGIYNVALGNLYAYYAALIRIYGTVKSYAYDNIYVPEGIMFAHGIDYQDIQQNIEKFRGWINLFAHKIMQFRMPAGFEYVNRMVWMNSNQYLDSQLTNAQIYQFVQMSFYQLQEGITAHSYQYYYKKQVKTVNYELWHLKLIPAPWAYDGVNINGVSSSQSGATTEDLIAFGENLLRPLTTSQDIKYISAGYERAFQTFMEVNPIAETFQIFPVYDESVLMQIENATFLNGVQNYGCTIAEDIAINQGNLVSDFRYLRSSDMFPNISIPGAMQKYFYPIQQYTSSATAQLSQADIMLNLHNKTEFTPADTMEASRLITYDANAIRVTYSTEDAWFTNAPVNESEYSSTTQSQGWMWMQLQTFASNVLFAPQLIVFRFNDYTKPWSGISKFGIALTGTKFITMNMLNVINSAFLTIPEAERGQFINFLQSIGNQEYLQQYALNLLSQWDWHPRWVRWDVYPNLNINTATNIATVSPTFAYIGQNMDIATYAMLGFKQLQDLNKYDMLSQFTNPQIGSYAVK